MIGSAVLALGVLLVLVVRWLWPSRSGNDPDGAGKPLLGIPQFVMMSIGLVAAIVGFFMNPGAGMLNEMGIEADTRIFQNLRWIGIGLIAAAVMLNIIVLEGARWLKASAVQIGVVVAVIALPILGLILVLG